MLTINAIAIIIIIIIIVTVIISEHNLTMLLHKPITNIFRITT